MAGSRVGWRSVRGGRIGPSFEDEFIDGIEACLYDDTAGNIAWLIAELRRAREVFRDLLTANSAHDVAWVQGRARYGLGLLPPDPSVSCNRPLLDGGRCPKPLHHDEDAHAPGSNPADAIPMPPIRTRVP